MHTSKMCGGHKVAWILLLIGGLNWGLVGVFNFDLVQSLFGGMPWLARLIYILVGVSAIMMLFIKKCCGGRKCKGCGEGKCEGGKCGGKGDDKCPKCGQSPCVCGSGNDMPKEGGEGQR